MCNKTIITAITIIIVLIAIPLGLLAQIKNTKYKKEMKKIGTRKPILLTFKYIANYTLIGSTSEKVILDEMKSRGIQPTDIELIFVTHYHQDHTGGLESMAYATKSPFAVSKIDEKYYTGSVSLPNPWSYNKFVNLIMKIRPRVLLPKVDVKYTFEGGEVLKDYEGMKVLYTPGHTNGSISLVTSSGDCFIGDAMVGSLFTANSPTLHFLSVYENYLDLRSTIKKLLNEKSCEMFYSGHGIPFSKKSLHDWIDENQHNLEDQLRNRV
eukprot:gene7312-11631_t